MVHDTDKIKGGLVGVVGCDKKKGRERELGQRFGFSGCDFGGMFFFFNFLCCFLCSSVFSSAFSETKDMWRCEVKNGIGGKSYKIRGIIIYFYFFVNT